MMSSKLFKATIFIQLIAIIVASNDKMRKYAESGDCRFYEEVEVEKKCGEKGYPVAFGFKYCSRSDNYLHEFDEEGRKWILAVKKCLMRKLLAQVDKLNDCKQLKLFAFDTHVECYTKPTTNDDGSGGDQSAVESFCQVLRPNLRAFKHVYILEDFLNKDALKKVMEIAAKCVEDFSRSLFTSTTEQMAKWKDDLVEKFNLSSFF